MDGATLLSEAWLRYDVSERRLADEQSPWSSPRARRRARQSGHRESASWQAVHRSWVDDYCVRSETPSHHRGFRGGMPVRSGRIQHVGGTSEDSYRACEFSSCESLRVRFPLRLTPTPFKNAAKARRQIGRKSVSSDPEKITWLKARLAICVRLFPFERVRTRR